jgi:transposase
MAGLALHPLYRAMAWLGEILPAEQQEFSSALAPRCTKDLIEEKLYGRRRDLFTQLDVVFFDTTSLYFEGDGGESLGQYGHNKDHRPDEKQMVVGAVLDGDGRPICCELWPGNTSDVTTLIPIVDRLWRNFRIRQICIVADRGMICQETIQDLEERGWPYILGARMRAQAEVRDEVLADAGRFRVVRGRRVHSKDPAPLKVKDVWVGCRRYVVCVNEEEVIQDQLRREAIVAGLREKLREGDKSLVGNKGYRKYLRVSGADHFVVDEEKINEEARYDGTWVLRTNTELPAAEVALQFKQLWQVEHWFRSCKSLLETRPIYHQRDATIRGHVFCSFLAMVLRHELQSRLQAKGHHFEWAEVIADLEALQVVEVAQDGKRFRLRTEVCGTCGRVFQAAGVALPPLVEKVS